MTIVLNIINFINSRQNIVYNQFSDEKQIIQKQKQNNKK